jgi:lysozyme
MSFPESSDTNEAGVQLIKSFEGFKSHPYICPAGIPTIGYGCTFYEDGTKVTMQDDPITESQGEDMLKHILASFEQGVAESVTVALTDNQFSALVCFAYNVGLRNLQNSTLLKMVNNSDFAGAALQFGKWVQGGGKVLPGLVRRRAAESALFMQEE